MRPNKESCEMRDDDAPEFLEITSAAFFDPRGARTVETAYYFVWEKLNNVTCSSNKRFTGGCSIKLALLVSCCTN